MAFWHSFFGSARHSDPNARRSTSTTPMADGKYRYALMGAILKLGLMVAIPLGALHYYGQPALRIQYEWNGNRNYPVYYQCDYLTLLNGWRDVHPRFGYCPMVTTFPFELSHLTGE